MRDIFKLGLRLLLFTVVAGLLLAITNAITEGPIAEQAELVAQNARKQVLTEAVDFEQMDMDLSMYPQIDGVYRGFDGDTTVGYAFSLSPMGFKAEIGMTLGINTAGAITLLSIDSQSETAGLGTKITGDEYLKQYQGQAASSQTLSGQIDGITGATVSARAVLHAVEEAVLCAEQEMGIVGVADERLAEDRVLTEEDLRRVSLIEGGRTINELTPYNALGYPAIRDIFEVSVKGKTAYVFDLENGAFELTLAIGADGKVHALTVENGEAGEDFAAQFARKTADSYLKDVVTGEAEAIEAVSQAASFYEQHLVGQGG